MRFSYVKQLYPKPVGTEMALTSENPLAAMDVWSLEYKAELQKLIKYEISHVLSNLLLIYICKLHWTL